MSPRRTAVAVALAVLGLAPLAGRVSAQGDDPVVVTVGSSTLTLREVERRLRQIPGYQLAAFGSSPEAIRKGFVEQVLVPELLYSEEARRRRMEEEPAMRDRIRDTLRQALELQLREEAARTPPTPEEVAAYFAENKGRFSTPERLRLARILVSSETDAQKLLAELGATITPARWGALARERSVDASTSLREGNLGFVRPDGQTDAPRVRVDPALYEAARRVADGEVVKAPVKEGAGWAVVWRRGSLPAVDRGLDQEERSIRQLLGRKRLDDRMNELTTRLRRERVKDLDEAPLAFVQVSTMGDVGERKRPGVVPRQHGRTPEPRETERGQR